MLFRTLFMWVNGDGAYQQTANRKPQTANRKILYEIALLLFPLILSSLATNSHLILDTLILGHANPDYLVVLGVIIQPLLIMYLIPNSLAVALGAMIAKASGENNQQKVGLILHQGLLIKSITTAVLGILVIFLSQHIIDGFAGGIDAEIRTLARIYLQIMAGTLVFRGITEGIGTAFIHIKKTGIAFHIKLVNVASNIILSFFLIFGFLSFPTLGSTGAAIAALLANLCSALYALYALYLYKRGKHAIEAKVSKGFKISWGYLKELVIIGLPTFFEQAFIRVGLFFVTLLIINLGSEDVLANQIVATITSVSYVFISSFTPLGSSIAGNKLGEKDLAGLKRYMKYIVGLAVGVSVAFVFLFGAFGEAFISFFQKMTS